MIAQFTEDCHGFGLRDFSERCGWTGTALVGNWIDGFQAVSKNVCKNLAEATAGGIVNINPTQLSG